MVEKSATDVVEGFGGFSASKLLFEVRVEALGDEKHGFFHALNVKQRLVVWAICGNFIVEGKDVSKQVAAAWGDGCGAKKGALQLGEEPGVTDCAAADHQAGGLCLFMEGEAGGDVDDVAVCDDGAGHGFDCVSNAVGMDWCAVAFGNGSAMDC